MGENILQQLPEHGTCFVCGGQNPRGMGVTWFVQEDHSIYAEPVLEEAQQGPPNLAHGGALAALLDEAMGAAVWRASHRAAAVNININYHVPVPLGVKIEITGRVLEVKVKRISTVGEIRLPDGTLAVSGMGTYVEAPQLFTELTSPTASTTE